MVADPCEAMGNIVAAEASLLQASADTDLLLDAEAISEAETQRSRLRDRLEAAEGLALRVHVIDASHVGRMVAAGDGILVIDGGDVVSALSVPSIVSIDYLPHALRPEGLSRSSVSVTWSSVLREWASSACVRLTLIDGRVLRARVDVVGSDHLDVRDCDGASSIVMFAAIRSAVISQ